MGHLPVITDIFRVAFNYTDTATGLRAVNVLNFHSTLTSPAAIEAAIESEIFTDMFQAMTNTAALESMTITPLDGVSASTTVPLSAGQFGGSAGDMIPAGCAEVMLQTGLRGQRNRGRIFLPFVAESAQASGTLGSTVLSDLRSTTQGWPHAIGAWGGAGVTLGVASYKYAAWEPCINVVIPPAMRTQRRRQSRLFAP